MIMHVAHGGCIFAMFCGTCVENMGQELMIVNRTRGQWHWENPASVEMILGILVDV